MPKTVLQIQGREPLPPVFQGKEWQVRHLAPDARAPDYTGRLDDLSAVPEGSLEGIFFVHLLPLYSGHALMDIAAGLYRRLKSDGLLVTLVPDGQLAAQHIANGKMGAPIDGVKQKIFAVDLLYGPERNFRQCFTAQTLGRLFREVGFENIQVTREDGCLWLGACKQPVERHATSDKIRIIDKYLSSAHSHPDALDVPPRQWVSPELHKL